MARKPNYDFERKERERLKKLQKAARAESKLKPSKEAEGEPADTAPAENGGLRPADR
jgi:hypothetical protein